MNKPFPKFNILLYKILVLSLKSPPEYSIFSVLSAVSLLFLVIHLFVQNCNMLPALSSAQRLNNTPFMHPNPP